MASIRAAARVALGPPWTIIEGTSPVVAAALHNGHDLRPEIATLMDVEPSDRRREEDPHTDHLTSVTTTRLIGNRSRFEVDLNRPPDEALCLEPDDCWGLELWGTRPPRALVEGSRELHDAFYSEMRRVLERMRRQHGRFAVLDIHSYNHRRGGPRAPPDDPGQNPDVNVGTRSLDHARWGRLLDRFITDLASHPMGLDVRENVKFRGRYFAAWIHEEFADSGCCLALEFKKTFMDEWTGVLDEDRLRDLTSALAATVPGLEAELARA
ncbi:MAG: N-formylglutamate amidohydrolase [Actinomycetota bacterium]|nr:N-formylglutamate amidohydrolase [Actinomycetota bacterium]